MNGSAKSSNAALQPYADIVVSYDCLPKIGGAHLWLHEVYRRWPTAVQWFTAEYSRGAADAAAERAFDAGEQGSISIHRRARRFEALSLLSPACIRRYASHVCWITRLAAGTEARIHALRSFPEGFAGLLYKWLHRRTRLITYAHGEEILIALMSRQLRWMAQQVYAASDLVIANSESTCNLVRELCPTANLVRIPPGVDVDQYRLSPAVLAEYRKHWGWPTESVVVSTVARMEPRKNQVAVLRAVAQLRAKGLAVTYVCAGDGEERAKLEELAATLEIGEFVRFPGRVSDEEKRLIFASSDIHAMPSIQIGEMIEGFGIVFLEAAAAGVPSICGDAGGQAEAVKHGETGFVVNGNSDADLAKAIETLARNSELRTQMGACGRAWAARHDWSGLAEQILQNVTVLPTRGSSMVLPRV